MIDMYAAAAAAAALLHTSNVSTQPAACALSTQHSAQHTPALNLIEGTALIDRPRPLVEPARD
eukprot:scaffold105968_cov61-Cyclotella_meneghiniana.AAC.3